MASKLCDPIWHVSFHGGELQTAVLYLLILARFFTPCCLCHQASVLGEMQSAARNTQVLANCSSASLYMNITPSLPWRCSGSWRSVVHLQQLHSGAHWAEHEATARVEKNTKTSAGRRCKDHLIQKHTQEFCQHTHSTHLGLTFLLSKVKFKLYKTFKTLK